MVIRAWAYAGAAAVLLGAFLWYRAALIQDGREQCREQVARAVAQQQQVANENAAIYESQRAERQVEYRTRVREVVRTVHANPGCDWDDDTFRMLNSAIDRANNPGKSE